LALSFERPGSGVVREVPSDVRVVALLSACV